VDFENSKAATRQTLGQSIPLLHSSSDAVEDNWRNQAITRFDPKPVASRVNERYGDLSTAILQTATLRNSRCHTK
jgi:hypothetical protein